MLAGWFVRSLGGCLFACWVEAVCESPSLVLRLIEIGIYNYNAQSKPFSPGWVHLAQAQGGRDRSSWDSLGRTSEGGKRIISGMRVGFNL